MRGVSSGGRRRWLPAAVLALLAAGCGSGGAVTAVVTGASELKSVTIDPSVVDPEDVETLQDLVVAAIRDANRAAQDLAGQRMGPLTQGMGGLGLPGM